MQPESNDEPQKRKQEAIRELALKLWQQAEKERHARRRPPPEQPDIADTWTLQEKLQKLLHWSGMSEDEAARIVERVKSLPIMEPLKDRWNEYAENWSPAFHGALWRQTTAAALKWMDENPTRDRKTDLRYRGFRSDVTP